MLTCFNRLFLQEYGFAPWKCSLSLVTFLNRGWLLSFLYSPGYFQLAERNRASHPEKTQDYASYSGLRHREQAFSAGLSPTLPRYPPLTRVSSAPGSEGSPGERSRPKLLLAHSSQAAARRHSGLCQTPCSERCCNKDLQVQRWPCARAAGGESRGRPEPCGRQPARAPRRQWVFAAAGRTRLLAARTWKARPVRAQGGRRNVLREAEGKEMPATQRHSGRRLGCSAAAGTARGVRETRDTELKRLPSKAGKAQPAFSLLIMVKLERKQINWGKDC